MKWKQCEESIFGISASWNFRLFQDPSGRYCWNKLPISHEGNAAAVLISSKKCLFWKFQKIPRKMAMVEHFSIELVHW